MTAVWPRPYLGRDVHDEAAEHWARDHILHDFLEFAVPVEMQRLSQFTDEHIAELGRECAQTITEKGDVIMFRQPGQTGPAMTKLIRGLACAAMVGPGGVTFAGHHWCRDHAVCEAAESAVAS